MTRSDEDLIIAYREGDSDAFTELVKRLGPGLLGYLRRMLKSQAEAEDLFQETFRKVLDKLDAFDTSRRFKPWLYRIAYNVTMDHFRKQNRGVDGSSIPITDEDNVIGIKEVTSEELTPIDQMDQQERKMIVRRAVESLPPRQKTTLTLAYFHEMTYNEVAETMGCSLGTVKTQMSRALRTLSGRLPDVSLQTLSAGGKS